MNHAFTSSKSNLTIEDDEVRETIDGQRGDGDDDE